MYVYRRSIRVQHMQRVESQRKPFDNSNQQLTNNYSTPTKCCLAILSYPKSVSGTQMKTFPVHSAPW